MVALTGAIFLNCRAEARMPAAWQQRFRLGEVSYDPNLQTRVFNHVFEVRALLLLHVVISICIIIITVLSLLYYCISSSSSSSSPLHGLMGAGPTVLQLDVSSKPGDVGTHSQPLAWAGYNCTCVFCSGHRLQAEIGPTTICFARTRAQPLKRAIAVSGAS